MPEISPLENLRNIALAAAIDYACRRDMPSSDVRVVLGYAASFERYLSQGWSEDD